MQQKTERDGIEVIPADVAKAAEASNTTVNYWLHDVNGMSAAKARLAGDYLGVNPLWLETGDGEMAPQRSHDVPYRPEGWSELTRVDAKEHRLLAVYRLADKKGRMLIDQAIDSAGEDIDLGGAFNQRK